MYVNKCTKCGREFETKNPKRVICPDCLYPDKKMMISAPSGEGGDAQSADSQAAPQPLRGYSTEEQPQFYSSYSSGGDSNRGSYSAGGYGNNRPQRQYNNDGYRRDNRQGGRPFNNQNRGFGGNRQGSGRPQGGFRPQGDRNYGAGRPGNAGTGTNKEGGNK